MNNIGITSATSVDTLTYLDPLNIRRFRYRFHQLVFELALRELGRYTIVSTSARQPGFAPECDADHNPLMGYIVHRFKRRRVGARQPGVDLKQPEPVVAFDSKTRR